MRTKRRFPLLLALLLSMIGLQTACDDSTGKSDPVDTCTTCGDLVGDQAQDSEVTATDTSTPEQTDTAADLPEDLPGDTSTDTFNDLVELSDSDTVSDTSVPDDGGDTSNCASGILCNGDCCTTVERCAYDQCVIDFGPCTTHDDCAGDSYCDADGRCTPYGVPSTVVLDDQCQRPIVVGDFAPEEQCRWVSPPAGDPNETMRSVYSAPMVADFDFDDDPGVLAPSIVVTTFHSPTQDGGILRIFDGRTCTQQYALETAADRLIYASNNAVGDINLDGRPDIVGVALASTGVGGGLVAFGYNPTTDAFERLWYGRQCELPGEPRHMPNEWLNNNGPAIHDLDDDGKPEILFERFVYDSNGCLLNPTATYSNYLRLGVFAVASDVDNDGLIELAAANGLYQWDTVNTEWVLEPTWNPPAGDATEAALEGMVAVANLVGGPGTDAEIVVFWAPSSSSTNAETGRVRVMNSTGQIIFGPFPLPAEGAQVAGRGGAPTIADFDGDGQREFAIAGASRYTVFDLDCDIATDTGTGCTRAAGLPRGVLWSQPSQDYSSNVTGSSVFDFDADGVAEVVYADECFVRIYRGTDGEVLFSSAASSGTGYEYPVIADVDGDYNSEIVVSLTAGPACPATDPLYTTGTSVFAQSTGFVVLKDADDRWAASRPIWNQHAYSVTNVNEDGTIPRTRDWTPNHTTPLNNFRQNAQGGLELTGLADLTVTLARLAELCLSSGGTITLGANVCNRGTNPVPDGARVVFYQGDPSAGGVVACETGLPILLAPAACTEVTCDWTVPSGQSINEVTVLVDPDDEVAECRNGNNVGAVAAILCSDYFN